MSGAHFFAALLLGAATPAPYIHQKKYARQNTKV
jgi:hypothetical protein